MRQSTSLAGSDEVSSAFLRRWVSLWARAEMRDFISATTLSSSSADCALSSRLVRGEPLGQLLRRRRWATMARTAGVPSTSLVWPSNCGSGRRTVSTAVRPARMSSFSSLSVPTLSRRAFCSTWVRRNFSSPCSKPAWWVPPLGVAMMLTKLRDPGVVAGAPAQRDVDLALALDLGGDHVRPWRRSTGTVSVNVPVPCRRQVSVSAGSGARNSHELGDAAVVEEDLLGGLLAALVADDDGRARARGTRSAGRGRPGSSRSKAASSREDLPVGPVADARAGDARGGLADDPQLAVRRRTG